MKKLSVLLLPLLFLSLIIFSCDTSQPEVTQPESQNLTLAKKGDCVTIQSGTLYASDGSLITTGYDKWGYNYQAMIFNGKYCDAYRNAAWCQPWKDDNLQMKWNEAWLSNKDCDRDGKLDRHFGYPSYIGSGAWLTNHMSGVYDDGTGNLCKWTYFVKIIAVPSTATKSGGYWYDSKGKEIGPVIWGEFAVIQEVYNDPCAGAHGLSYKSAVHPGLGGWK
jgi:hypothetical protein